MIVIVVIVVVMVMIVIVVMVVVIVVIMMVMTGVVRIRVQLLGGHRLLLHARKLGDEVDHLVLEDRGPDLGERLRVVAVEIVNLPLLSRKLPHALEESAVHLVVR